MGNYKCSILRTMFLVVLISTTILVNIALGQTYCTSNGNNTSYEWIESTLIGTTLNGFGSQGGYADFTSQTIYLDTGVHNVTLTPGFNYGSYTEYWKIWLDLNQDGNFEAAEMLYSGSSSGPLNGQILIPAGALEGETRMRISMKYGGLPLACGFFTYGEVEDYTVYIQAGGGYGPPDPDPGTEPVYCDSKGNITSYEWIEGVAVGSFFYTSGVNDGYGDFTGQIVTLVQGPNEFTLTPGFRYGAYNEYWRVWIDLDQDGVFGDEEVLFSGNSQGTLSGEILVPPGTPEGDTRMRIAMSWGGEPPSCGSFTYGEVEDYTVRVEPEVVPPVPALGEISSIVAGNDPEFVYAIDRDNQALYFISTSLQQIVETVSLPDAEPVAMDYSESDNDLYIVSASTGKITVFDLDTSGTFQIGFSNTKTGRDIEIAPDLGRIFVLSPNGYSSHLTILDMDTGSVLLEDTVGGSSIAVDESNQMIFTGDSGISPSTIRKYHVGNDTLQLVQSTQAGSNGRQINISPDGHHVVFPCGSGNGPGYTIYDFDSTELNNVFGEWDVGTYPKIAVLSPDGKVFFGTNGSPYDNYLYVMDAATYEQITKIDFPNADDYAVIAPNSDGTVVVGFSYDTYYDENYSLYFFTVDLP